MAGRSTRSPPLPSFWPGCGGASCLDEHEIERARRARRLPTSCETALQAEIAAALTAAGISYTREYRLGLRSRRLAEAYLRGRRRR